MAENRYSLQDIRKDIIETLLSYQFSRGLWQGIEVTIGCIAESLPPVLKLVAMGKVAAVVQTEASNTHDRPPRCR